MSGLAFHQAGSGDAAAVTYNVVNALYGGELWDAKDRKIEGVINDAAGKKAMDVLVNEMVPLTPKGSSNWFIDEVNAAISQGKVCVGVPVDRRDAAASSTRRAPTLGKTQGGDPQEAGVRAAAEAGHRQGAARRHGPARLARTSPRRSRPRR